MATKAWFDYATYMSNKLTQMQETYPNEKWTASSLQKAFDDAGYVGDEGAQRHFNKWGHTEDVSPNKYFDAKYYYEAKAIQYYGLPENGGLTKAQVEADLATYAKNMEGAIKAAGMDAWTHYIKWGTAEGINPSNSFDTSAYMAAKVEAMAGSMTEDEVYAAFKKANLNALEHFMQYAGKGASEVESTDISDFAVPEDEKIDDGGISGSTYNLTVNQDIFKGTTGDDMFEASLTSDRAVTLHAYDKLDGGAGSDTLIAQGVGGFTSNSDTLQNIENLQFYGGNGAINLGNTSGVESILIANPTAGRTVSGINAGIKEVAVTGDVDADAEDTHTFKFANAAVAGSTDAVTLKVDGVGADDQIDNVVLQPTSGVNGFETITVEATGSQSYVRLGVDTSTSLSKVATKGSTALKLTVNASSVKEFDASAATAAQTVDLSESTQDMKVTGSAQNDSIAMGANLNKNDVIDGGDGEDTLSFASAAMTLTDTFQVSNIENLAVTDALAANLDVSKFGTGIKGVSLGATSAADRTISGLADKATLTLGAVQTETHTVKLTDASGTDNTVNLVLSEDYSTAGAEEKDFGDVTVADVENLTINTSFPNTGTPDNAGDHAAVGLTAAAAKSLTITGKVGLEIDTALGSNLVKVDSTGLTPEVAPAAANAASLDNYEGGIKITLGTLQNVAAEVKTGNGNNVVTSVAGNDKVTFGAGKDTFQIGTGDDTGDMGAGDDLVLITANEQLDKKDVLKGGDGTDIIRFGAGASVTLSDDAFTGVSGFERLESAGTTVQTLSLNLGSNAANAFNNAIRVDQISTSTDAVVINGSSLSSSQTLDFRGLSTAGTADTIVGGAASDKICGGLGVDTMTGGNGSDVFYFRDANDAGTIATTATDSSTLDHITDFNAGVDKIQLGITSGAFATGVALTSSTKVTLDGTLDAATASTQKIDSFADVLTAVTAAITSTHATTAENAYAYLINTGTGNGGTATDLANRTFLVINDEKATIDQDDTWIDITGVTGTISGSDFVIGDLYSA